MWLRESETHHVKGHEIYKVAYIRDLPRLCGIQIIYAFGSKAKDAIV